MELILGNGNSGTEEMQKYFSHIPGTIEFAEMRADLLVAQEDLFKFVGEELIASAVDHYLSDDYESDDAKPVLSFPENGWADPEEEDDPKVLTEDEKLYLWDVLVGLIQNAVTLLGYREYALSNDATHTKTGRMARMDKDTDEWTDKLIEHDDRALVRKGQRAIARLIKFVTKWQFPAFVENEPYISTKDLYVWSSEMFHRFHPIDHDDRLYMLLLPIIRSVQQDYIDPAIEPARRAVLLDQSHTGKWDEDVKILYDKVGYTIAYLSMAKGYKELPVQLFPESMARNFWAAGNGAAFIAFRDKISGDTHTEGMRKLQVLLMHLEKMRATETQKVITDDDIVTIDKRMDATNKFVRV